MFQWICQPGSYWDPKPFWWLRNSWVATVSIRILQAFRLVAWIAWTAISFVGTLVSDVIFPLVQWLWALFMGFTQFYVSLLMGHLAVEVLLFLPFLLLGFAWLWWLFWPEIGCWLDSAWPFFRLLLDVLVAIAGVLMQVFNVLVRMWDSFVPVLGFLVYFTVDLTVQFYRGVVSLIGEANVELMFDGLSEISMFTAEITVNVALAFINISPTLLQVFSTVVGGLLNTILEIAPVLLQINFVVFRILPFKIGPIADLVVKVVTFVKKTFFLRNLLELGAVSLSAASSISGAGRLASTASEPRNGVHTDQQLMLWRVFGESASRYWTAETAQQSSEHLSRINAWLLKNPPGSHTDYYALQGGDLLHSSQSYYAGSAPLRGKRGDSAEATECSDECEPSSDEERHASSAERPPRMSAELPEAWQTSHNDSAHSKSAKLHYPYEGGEGPLNADPLYYLSAEQRHKLETEHERFSEKPLTSELHKRLPCRSHFCGGETQTLEHPMRTIGKTHVRDRTMLSSLVPTDIRAHRKRSAHLSTLLHSTQRTAHRGFSIWRANKQHVYKSAGDMWQRWTGHASFGSAMEKWTSRYEDPADSLLSWTPVLSEVWPFSSVLAMHPPEVQAQYYGRWASKRRFFIQEIDDEYTGAKRKVVHITLNEYNKTVSVGELQTRAKRQQGLGAGGISVKPGVGNEDMDVANGYPSGQPQEVSGDFIPIVGETFLIFGTGGVGLAAGAFISGRLLEPALPVLKLLYKLNCFDNPKHPFCIPELPTQLICILRFFLRQVPRNLPVSLCKFEEECADLHFCIHPRPPVKPVVSIVRSRAYFVSWCWIQNFFAWTGIALGLAFPALRFSFFVAETVVPVFGPLIFGTIRRLIPEPVSQQDSVCLIIYIYAPLLILFLLWLFRFAWAMVLWAFGAFQGLLGVFEAIRGIELARLESLSQEPWVDEMRLRLDKDKRHVLYHDAVFKAMYPVHPTDPRRFYNPYEAGEYHRLLASRPPGTGPPMPTYTDYDTTGLPLDQATEATVRSGMYSQVPLPVPVEQRIGAADIEQPRRVDGGMASALLNGRAPITEYGAASLRMFIQSLERGARIFGQASSEPTTVHHVFAHEARWHPVIHSAHYSATWLASRLAEDSHQRAQYARRRPPPMSYMRGLFGWQ